MNEEKKVQNSNIIEGFSELREVPFLRPEKGVTY